MQLTRRRTLVGVASWALWADVPMGARAEELQDEFDQLLFPPRDALADPAKYGYRTATSAERERADDIVANTPRGPKPVDVAQSFVSRFYDGDPRVISQWPAPDTWNPLVVHFFNDATQLKVHDDMVDWCAAFVNWCIWWTGGTGSGSAWSQSFLASSFQRSPTPERGDLAVFTCFDPSGKSLGLGHVGFVKEPPSDPARVVVIGGNTSKDGHSSIICERSFPTGPWTGKRHVAGRLVPCTIRLSAYARVH